MITKVDIFPSSVFSIRLMLNHLSLNWITSFHYIDVIMITMASQITTLTIVDSTVTGLCVGNSPGPVNSPHKGPVTRKMFPFDDVIMQNESWHHWESRLMIYVHHEVDKDWRLHRLHFLYRRYFVYIWVPIRRQVIAWSTIWRIVDISS